MINYLLDKLLTKLINNLKDSIQKDETTNYYATFIFILFFMFHFSL